MTGGVAKAAPSEPVAMPPYWQVEVQTDSRTVVSIGHDWLSGNGEPDEADERTILGAAQHLLAFIGYGLPPCNFDPDAAAPPPPAAPAEPIALGVPWWQIAKDHGCWTDKTDGDMGLVHFGSTEALRVFVTKITAMAYLAGKQTSAAPVVNKLGDTLKPEWQAFMRDAADHLNSAAAPAVAVEELAFAAQQIKPHSQTNPSGCKDDGRCQYAVDYDAEGMGHCPRGKCAMAQQVAREAIDEAITAAEQPRTQRIGPDDESWDDGYLNGIKACGTVVLAALAAPAQPAPQRQEDA
jgi:hypothetical protein